MERKLWTPILLIAMATAICLPHATASDAQSKIISTLDFAYYDGAIIYISVTQTPRDENDALFSTVIGGEPASDMIGQFGESLFGAYCEMNPLLDADGNEIWFSGFGEGAGKTIRSYFYAELPDGFAPETLRVSVVTGLVLPGAEELAERYTLPIDLTLDDSNVLPEYPLDQRMRIGTLTRLVQRFVPGQVNMFTLEHVPTRLDDSLYWDYALQEEGRENIDCFGYGDASDDGITLAQTLFFTPSEKPPEKLIVRLTDFSGEVADEFSIDLNSAR